MTIKKNGGMMYVKNKPQKSKKTFCCVCGKELTPATACYYVDSCNCAITNNAKPYCEECYIKKYGRY